MPRLKRTHSTRSTTSASQASQPQPTSPRDASLDVDVDAHAHIEPDPSPPIPSQPTAPIVASYTYSSPVPPECSRTVSTGSARVPCVLGVDEAGRGPVLGPLVYGIAYCPIDYQDQLEQIGFADSKALTAQKRTQLLSALIDTNSHLGWSVRVMSPQDISSGMLRRRPTNLNAQSSQATVSLIAGVLSSGVDLTDIYVDTVGDPTSYSRLLSSNFPNHPHINWTVTSKADTIYPIVGAASIAAKVTRDRCMQGWQYIEMQRLNAKRKMHVLCDKTNVSVDPIDALDHLSTTTAPSFPDAGSGYPSDPTTVSYLKSTMDPIFGWPGIVRFSWATVKTLLDEKIPRPSSSSSSSVVGTKRKSLRSTSSTCETLHQGGTSKWGTKLPTTGTRGYKVKWTDQGVAISCFFSKTPPLPTSSSSMVANDALATFSRSLLGDNSASSEAELIALRSMLVDERNFQSQSQPPPPTTTKTTTKQNDKIAKISKELGIVACSSALGFI